ncbi:MAG TPA: PadR family transcriptional regulator [Vicinamibacterales bacterium]|nr:PadR family transcriptional regulator [Vicinamibacterales bacterium]
MSAPLRWSPQTQRVFAVFMHAPNDWQYGYDISRNTGLKSGTLYPILMRMAERKLLDTCWEPSETGKPPRHMYRFTPRGLRLARERFASPSTRRALHAAFGGVKG